MSVDYKDYYKILEIDRKASDEDIQKAYKKLARKYHPDLNQGDASAEEKFKDIGEAYEVLKDPQKRAQYDALGSAWKDGQRFTPPPGWGGFGGRNVNINMGDLGGMSDFFKAIFGGLGGQAGGFSGFGGQNAGFGGFGGQNAGFSGFGGFGGQQGPSRSERFSEGFQQGDPSPIDITLTLEQVLDENPKNFTIQMGGTQRDLKIKIPKGAKSKSVFKLKGQGPNGTDLRIRLNIAPHDIYEIDEYDLKRRIKISPWEAALGTQIDIPTIDGNVKLKIPAGIQSGQKLRIPSKGLNKRIGRGDLFVEVMIAVPQKLSSREKELFQKLAEESAFNPRA